MNRGYTQVVDADLKSFFDTITHSRLLKLIAKRITDKNILRLIKLWLKAGVVSERAILKSFQIKRKPSDERLLESSVRENLTHGLMRGWWKHSLAVRHCSTLQEGVNRLMIVYLVRLNWRCKAVRGERII